MELTKYEIARLIGARALQISMGAPALIKISDEKITFVDIAAIELEKGILPLVVLRKKSKETAG